MPDECAKRNGSHILRYHAYFIPSNLQLKSVVAFSYGDSLTAGFVSRTDWKAAKVAKTYEQNGDHEESAKGADILEVGNYFISSENL